MFQLSVSTRPPRCYYDLHRLTPIHKNEGYNRFCQCTECGAYYHERCWSTLKRCLRCHSSNAQPVTVKEPPPIQPVYKKKAIVIRPKQLPVDGSGELPAEQAQAGQRRWPLAVNPRQLLRLGLANLLGLAFLAFGVLAGIYGWYALGLLVQSRGQISPDELWGFITKIQPPSIMLVPAVIGVGAAAFLFFRKGEAGSPLLMRLAAVLVPVGMGNILVLPITRTNLPELTQINARTMWIASPDNPVMLLLVEGIAAAVVLLLSILYRRAAPLPSPTGIPRRSLAQVKWLVIGIVLVFLAGWTVFQLLDRTGARVGLQEVVDFLTELRESLPLYAVLGATAALVYSLPSRNPAFGSLKLVRGFIFLVCLVGIFLGYNSGVLPLRVPWIIVGVSLIVLLVPLQRVLCTPRPYVAPR